MDFIGFLCTVAAACGIPAAITGLVIRRFEKRLDAKEADKLKDEHDLERAREKSMILLVKGVGASIALGEATAHAMQLGHPNGDMEAALSYAQEVKHAQKDFLTEQASRNLYN